MRRVMVLIVLVSVLIGVVSAQAQEPQCSDEDVQAVIDEALAVLSGGGYESTIQARQVLAQADVMCLGLDFEGTTDMVGEPVYVPEGLYRATLEINGDENDWMDTDLLVLEGDCYEGTRSGNVDLFDWASSGDESVLTSEGCTVIFVTEYTTAPYTVIFEKLK